jgi:hypothetical protein
MSDDANQFYNAWTTVMCNKNDDVKPIKLLCSWHVSRNIRKNVIKFVNDDDKIEFNLNEKKIKKKKKKLISKSGNKRSVLNNFFQLRNELDPVKFDKKLKEFLNLIKQFPEFDNYFRNYYLNRLDQWTYIRRKYLKINTNMSQENYHKIIKQSYFHNKATYRVDKCIFLILKHLNNKIDQRILNLDKGKCTKRSAFCFKNHKLALQTIDQYNITNDGSFTTIKRKFNSENVDNKEVIETLSENECDLNNSDNNLNNDITNDDDFYELLRDYKEDDSCLVCIRENVCKLINCPLKCKFCSTCLCSVSCDCLDFALKYNFCIHIHLALISRRESCKLNENQLSDGELTDDADEIKDKENECYLNEYNDFDLQEVNNNDLNHKRKAYSEEDRLDEKQLISNLSYKLDEIKEEFKKPGLKMSLTKFDKLNRLLNETKQTIKLDLLNLPQFILSPSKKVKMYNQNRLY